MLVWERLQYASSLVLRLSHPKLSRYRNPSCRSIKNVFPLYHARHAMKGSGLSMQKRIMPNHIQTLFSRGNTLKNFSLKQKKIRNFIRRQDPAWLAIPR